MQDKLRAYFENMVALCMGLLFFWLLWTVWGFGEKYFFFLPKVYLSPTFLECFALYILGAFILYFLRRIVRQFR